MMQIEVTGVLLAGGKSRRMGEDKRYLVVGEQTLLERGLGVLRSIFQEVLVVIAQDNPPLGVDARVVRDLVPDCGSLGGLYTGLTQATAPCIFVVACDMPFLNQAVIAQFTSQEIVSHASLRVQYVTEADLLTIDPSWHSFQNVNTPADLEAARSLLARVPPSGQP